MNGEEKKDKRTEEGTENNEEKTARGRKQKPANQPTNQQNTHSIVKTHTFYS